MKDQYKTTMQRIRDSALEGIQGNEAFKNIEHEFMEKNMDKFNNSESFLKVIEDYFKNKVLLYRRDYLDEN